jgi:hypothetical protein
MLLQYAPLVIGLICIVVCYLLFKKIQTLNSHGDSVSNIEKHFTNFVKEQSEVNTINGKKFNAMMSQINQLTYIVQNSNSRETNSFVSQMSPERQNNTENEESLKESLKDIDNKLPAQPIQRELMPTSVIQTNFPIKTEAETLPTPISTTNKKEIENLATNDQQKQTKQSKNNKKVIDLQTLKEEVLIEEASSDED